MAASWNKPAAGDKTITGCTVGKPVIVVHKAVGSGNWGWCYIRVKSGTAYSTTSGHHYFLGVAAASSNDYRGGVGDLVIIPNATTVVINLDGCSDDDAVYVYK